MAWTALAAVAAATATVLHGRSVPAGQLRGVLSNAAAARRRLGLTRVFSRRRRGATYDLAEAVDAPLLLELMAATLSAGATPAAAVGAVVDSLPESAAVRLRPVAAALALGATPAQAFAPLLDDGELRPVAAALRRAAAAGSRAAESLHTDAAVLRDERRALATAAAHRAGVRAVVPLGVCFLPAFVLLGIVPNLVGLAASTFGAT